MSNTKKNLGHVTAYAYYKAGGGTMTEEEFTEYMADFGDAAERAVDAASEAAQSKADAQTAAATATDKADIATTAATSASGSATSASQSATTATSAANTATGAATTATNAKNDAVSAKNAAQTAQAAAESAAAYSDVRMSVDQFVFHADADGVIQKTQTQTLTIYPYKGNERLRNATMTGTGLDLSFVDPDHAGMIEIVPFWPSTTSTWGQIEVEFYLTAGKQFYQTESTHNGAIAITAKDTKGNTYSFSKSFTIVIIRDGADGTVTTEQMDAAIDEAIEPLKEDLGNVEDFSNTVYTKVFKLEKESYETIINILPVFKSGYFETNGYVYDDRWVYLTTQVFQPGKYNIVAPTGFQFEIYHYNSDSSGTLFYNYRGSVNREFANPFVLTFRHETDPASTRFYGDDIISLRNNLTFEYNKGEGSRTLIEGLSADVVAEFYLLDNTYTPYGCSAKSNQYRMKLKDGNGNVRVNGQDVAPTYYSDKLQRFVDPNTGEIVAYYILHYTGTDYVIDSTSLSFTEYAKSLDTNPIIKEYLSRSENLVLIGDSIFGYYDLNVLEAILSTISDKKIYNCGFGGCRMAWRNASGTDQYDPYSFVSVIDAIVADDYTSQTANKLLNQGYPYAIANLKDIDWSKPTTIFVNYVNNDITGNVAIGDVWEYTDTSEDFNKQTVLGAFNYGLKVLLTEYPHIRVVEFTSAYRKLGDNSLPPYAYTNGISLSPNDYDEAIKENADRLGISVYDFHKFGGRNWLNIGYYQQDASHYNEKGFALFAKIIDAVDKSFID